MRDRLQAVIAEPSWPTSVERPIARRGLGVDYDTSWARRPVVRGARRVLFRTLAEPTLELLARPSVLGRERLDELDGPAMFAANHSSHLDTSLLLASLPPRLARTTVVAAAADYFFDERWKAALWAFTLNTIPIDRTRVNRRWADLASELLEEGWSVIIFPEGGRTPDGWGQEFSGGAAYLAKRAGVPVVPVHLRGVRPMLAKGSSALRPGRTEVRFGAPLTPLAVDPSRGDREEDARRFGARIERAVAELADEAASDWWSARRRAASGETPPLRGPEASAWRRAWALPEDARRDGAPRRLGPSKPW